MGAHLFHRGHAILALSASAQGDPSMTNFAPDASGTECAPINYRIMSR